MWLGLAVLLATTVAGGLAFLFFRWVTGKWGVPTHFDRMKFSCSGAIGVAGIVAAVGIFFATEIVGSSHIEEPSTGTGSSSTVTVSADEGWMNSGVRVDSGEEVEITATGEWYPFGNGYGVGPEGCTNRDVCAQEFNQPENVCCMAHAGLIGRIDDEQPFRIGEKRTHRNDGAEAELYLRINDRRLIDNSGDIRVTIKKLSR